jgi:hypothetical protein
MSDGGPLLLNRNGMQPKDVGSISEIKRIYSFRLFCGLVEEFSAGSEKMERVGDG